MFQQIGMIPFQGRNLWLTILLTLSGCPSDRFPACFDTSMPLDSFFPRQSVSSIGRPVSLHDVSRKTGVAAFRWRALLGLDGGAPPPPSCAAGFRTLMLDDEATVEAVL